MNDGIIYSSRLQAKIKSVEVTDGLKEMFSKVMEIELVPQVKKMLAENDLKPMRGFANWDTGFNTFTVEIFGASYTPGLEFEIENPDELTLDAAHFEENLFYANDQVLKSLLNEIGKQNITGRGHLTQADVGIAMLEHNYVFRILWTADPSSERRIKSNARNN